MDQLFDTFQEIFLKQFLKEFQKKTLEQLLVVYLKILQKNLRQMVERTEERRIKGRMYKIPKDKNKGQNFENYFSGEKDSTKQIRNHWKVHSKSFKESMEEYFEKSRS